MDASLHKSALTARSDIASGALRGPAFFDLLMTVPLADRDAWVDQVLGFEGVPDDVEGLPRESVPYLPCGTEEILAAVLEGPIAASDEFVDLGSGTGRVAMLVHLLTGARCSGIELQQPLVQIARDRCTELQLTDVTFVHGDASISPLTGSVFFLYAPFTGEALARTLSHLKFVAAQQPIMICAVGLEFHDVPWLLPRTTSSLSLTIYASRVP